jgi:alpha-tubulin suppressor-like RCC1 family protein
MHITRSWSRAAWLGCAAALVTVAGAGSATAGVGTATSRPASAAVPVSAESWGDNTAGELGNGTAEQGEVPAGVANLPGIKAISAGNRFTLALLANGTVMAWGNNVYGQLGDGSDTDSDVPVRVNGLSGVTAVAAGGEHALALLSNGTVMAWGDNQFGQLGTGTMQSSDVPVAVLGLSGVTGVSAGALHSLALLGNGTAEAWGYNEDAQLGDGTLKNSDVPVKVHDLSDATAVSAGGEFSLALLRDGTVRAWGNGELGQLGVGQPLDSSHAVKVHKLTKVTAISAGYWSALAVRSDGKVMAWGEDDLGETPDEAPVRVPVPSTRGVAAGGTFGLVLLRDGTVWDWGGNDLGQLGNGTDSGGSSTPAQVAGLSGVTSVAAGDDHAVVTLPAVPPTAKRTPVSIFRLTTAPDPVPPPDGLSSDAFTAVSAASASDALAVGPAFDEAATSRPFADHWNGTAWQGMLLPRPKGRESVLTGVADVQPGDAWAVGTSMTPADSDSRTLIEHWNGTSWSIVPSPNPSGGETGVDELQAVAAVSPDDVWAAGAHFSDEGSIDLLFEHWNGTTWSVVPTPRNGQGFAFGLAALAANDVWLVGTTDKETVSAHWNGHRWTMVPTPQVGAGPGPDPNRWLTGVTGVSATNVWASGYADNVNDENLRKPYVLHWNGTKWTLTLVPNPGTEGSNLAGITATGADNVVAVGTTVQDGGSLLTLTEQFNGTAWTAVPSPDPGNTLPVINNGLAAAASHSGRIWAVGYQNRPGQCCDQPLAITTTDPG